MAWACSSCSACENRSAAIQSGSVSPSQTTRISDGPAIMSMPTVPNTSRLAAATKMLPGPTIFVPPPGWSGYRRPAPPLAWAPPDGVHAVDAGHRRGRQAPGRSSSPPGAGTTITSSSDPGHLRRDPRSSAPTRDRRPCRPGTYRPTESSARHPLTQQQCRPRSSEVPVAASSGARHTGGHAGSAAVSRAVRCCPQGGSRARPAAARAGSPARSPNCGAVQAVELRRVAQHRGSRPRRAPRPRIASTASRTPAVGHRLPGQQVGQGAGRNRVPAAYPGAGNGWHIGLLAHDALRHAAMSGRDQAGAASRAPLRARQRPAAAGVVSLSSQPMQASVMLWPYCSGLPGWMSWRPPRSGGSPASRP